MELKWQIPFVSNSGTHYRIDIYADDHYVVEPILLQPGETPFTTDEDDSDKLFEPVRSQTGKLQICTLLEDGSHVSLDDLIPLDNISRPVYLLNLDTNEIEWQGFLSCEAYSQNYTTTPEILSLPVISVLEAMRSVSLSSYWTGQEGVKTVGSFISNIIDQIENDLGMQVSVQYSQSSNDILDKYIFIERYFTYNTEESTGDITYIYSATSLFGIMEDICKFMGWCLREHGTTFYFTRIGSDELGMTEMNMSALEWMGVDHKRSIIQGAQRVRVESKLEEFKTSFEMPICPYIGLNTATRYNPIATYPLWYYEKCTQLQVRTFVSGDINKCFLSRFYGVSDDGVDPWNTVYTNIGFSNAIYLVGMKYDSEAYVQLCTIRSILDFSVICAKKFTREDAGHFVLRITEETAKRFGVNGYMRLGFKFGGYYYNNALIPWMTVPTSFKVSMSNGSGSVSIPLPRINDEYTFMTSQIEVYIYDDFDIGGRRSAVVSNITVSYEPPIKKNTDKNETNKYIKNLYNSRDEIKIDENLASSFNNRNSYSHVYGRSVYSSGGERVYYYEPIQALTYNLADGTTATRRPEVDLLNRMAAYYGIARQRLELITRHPTAAPLAMLKLNGIGDGKKYLPLSESRDWKTDECTLICFEIPQ